MDEDKTIVSLFRSGSHIDFPTQCVIMTFAGGCWWGGGGAWAINNDVLKFRKVIEFECSCTVICISYIYLIIHGKRSFINLGSS